MGKRSAVVELFLGDMGSMQRELRPSIQREDQPTMETKLEQIAAKAVKQRPKSVVREIRTPRSVGTGGGRPPPATRGGPRHGCPYRNRVLEPSQFIRLLDTAFAFCQRDRRRIGDRSHLPQALKIGRAPDRCRLHTPQNWSRTLFTHLLGRAM